MKEFRIEHPHNEASALVAIHNRALLEARGWDVGFWIASDEHETPKAIAALGRQQDGTWSVTPLEASLSKRSDTKNAEDCETLARAGAWIYVFGSQYGAKGGPLQPKRHFVARFNESLVDGTKDPLHVELDLVRRPFLLHRLINDALREHGVKLIACGEAQQRDFIEATLENGRSKSWRELVRDGDHPINIEGSTFLPGGRVLLGLRYPVTAGGHPLLVEIDGIDRLFDAGDPEVTAVWMLENVGSKEAPSGVRELDQRGTSIHVVSGNLESKPEESSVLADHPHGEHAVNAHWRFEVPTSRRRVEKLTAELVREFDRSGNVEGLAVHDDGTVWYVHDDEQIRLAVAKL